MAHNPKMFDKLSFTDLTLDNPEDNPKMLNCFNNNSHLLFMQTNDIIIPNSTTLIEVYSVIIPANFFIQNDALRICNLFQCDPTSTNKQFTFKLKNDIYEYTLITSVFTNNTTIRYFNSQRHFFVTNNSLKSQSNNLSVEYSVASTWAGSNYVINFTKPTILTLYAINSSGVGKLLFGLIELLRRPNCIN